MEAKTKLGLGKSPHLINCGLAEHGFHGEEQYELPKLWCLHLYFYAVEMQIGDWLYRIVPGTVTLIPPSTRMIYRYANKRYRHFFVHFSGSSRKPMVDFPISQHIPEGRDELLDRLQNVQRLFHRNRLHAETLFWGILWDLAEAGESHGMKKTNIPPKLKSIEEFIEERLPSHTTVADVAKHLQLTTTQINRIIRLGHGITAVQFIRKRRLQRAYRLLIHSTMPIKLIAAESGIPDLQQFNKQMREEYGKGPRELRASLASEEELTWAMNRE